MCASPNAKVLGILTMLSPMKPRKKFDTITGTFVFHCVSFIIAVHSSCSVCANALIRNNKHWYSVKGFFVSKSVLDLLHKYLGIHVYGTDHA